MIMALDQQARLVPNGNAEWTKRSRQSLVAQPCLGGVDERCRDLGILGLEHPPLAGACAHMDLHKIIDLGGNAANHPSLALGEKEHGPAVLEPRIALGRNQSGNFAFQRRHPMRIIGIEPVRQIDERSEEQKSELQSIMRISYA